jgi:hypothetical protein
MKTAKFARNGKTIRNIETGEVTMFASITKAKAESRRLQMQEDGALGRGSLIVV